MRESVCCLHVFRLLGKLEEQQLFAHARHKSVGRALLEFRNVCCAILAHLAGCQLADNVLPGFSHPGPEGAPGEDDEVLRTGPLLLALYLRNSTVFLCLVLPLGPVTPAGNSPA